MKLLIDHAQKRSVTSLCDDRMARLPSVVAGDTLPLAISKLTRIENPYEARLFTPDDLSQTTFRVALGAGFIAPVGGTFTLTGTGGTTDPILYNPTAFELQSALNAVLTNAVEVEGEYGFFVITAAAVGSRGLLTADAGSLVPTSLIDIQRSVTGDSDTRDVQTLRIVQSAAALATIDTAEASAGITIEEVQTGQSSPAQNHQVRVTMTGDIYAGTWLFSTADGQSEPIRSDSSAAQVRRALEAITGVGTGNVSVVQETAQSFLITFIGDLAGTVVNDADVDGSNLLAVPALSGELDLAQPAVFMLLNGAESRVVSLEIEAQLGSDAPVKILQQDLLLVRPVIEPAMTSPTAQADLVGAAIATYSGSGTALTVSSAGTTDLAPAAAFFQWTQRITANAGSGAYTRKFTLDTSKAVEGAKFFIPLSIAASDNPTLQFFNETISSQIGDDIVGAANGVQNLTVVFSFENGAWVPQV